MLQCTDIKKQPTANIIDGNVQLHILSNFCLTNIRNLKVFLEVHGRDIDFAKSEQSYHLTNTDAEAAAVRLLLPLHRKRYIPESYSIVCIYLKWH